MDVVNENYNKTYLHGNIRAMRKKLKLSQEELAARIGLNRGNIASYENGSAEPKICNLLKMAQLFEVSLIDLIQSDLSDEQNFLTATQPGRFLNDMSDATAHYIKKAKELEAVIDGLNTCCRYKIKMLEEELPKEMRLVALHFEELYNTAQVLMRQHISLLHHIDGSQNGYSPYV